VQNKWTALAREFLDDYPSLRGQALIMYLSRLHPKKGLDLLIPAFAILAGQFPKAQLVLVGPGHKEYVEHLKQLAEQQRVAQRVHFLGSLDGRAKWAALAAAHVFVLPSYQENFAIVVAEALRMGVPVVLSKRVNIWEEVVASGGAMSCELTSASIASAVQPWIENSGAATAAGQKGQEYARRHFTWDRSANAMSEVYATILNIEPSNHASVNS
jgi:glycosyltransferase involved in cell wall biosynthesis